jgi:hypothetical protein
MLLRLPFTVNNLDIPFIRELYSGFIIREVEAQRAIKGSKRTGHKEGKNVLNK